MSKFAKDTNYKKKMQRLKKETYIFLYFSPGNLVITLYQLSNFGAPSCNGFCDIKFSISKFAKGNN